MLSHPPFRRVTGRTIENGERLDLLVCGHTVPGTRAHHRRRRCHRCHENRRREISDTADRFIRSRRRQFAETCHTQEEPDQ
ncbi:MAG: hypothetical protein ACI81R_001917 [Bradymonadia bacterium]|jgi:hypothetical protein